MLITRQMRLGKSLNMDTLGILSAFEDVGCRFPLSNRESGMGDMTYG